MLAVNDISIQYGNECVLQHFSCHIGRGDFACITGVSGCGKTSLLRAFIGLTPLAEGTISVGECILNEKTCTFIRKNTLYLPQELSFPSETVNDLAVQTLRVVGVKNVQISTLMLLENFVKLGLDEELLHKRLSEISGGQRQRIMLATLALLNKEVWLLDEPTAALDELSRNCVIDFLLEHQQRGKTIVAVSHDMHFASRCSTVISLG